MYRLHISSLALLAAAAFTSATPRAAGTTATVAVLHNFVTSDGTMALQGMIKAANGNFYGTTETGGKGNGTVYELSAAGRFSVLHSFANDTLATNPVLEGVTPTHLIQGADGNLYGICIGGGAEPSTPEGGGTFFRLSMTGAFTKLYDFDTGSSNADCFPVALVQGKDLNFYGLSRVGGKTGLGEGAFFRLSPTGKFTELYAFFGSNNGLGDTPMAQLLVGKDGNFYGTTTASGGDGSGAGGSGAIFKATIAGAVTLVHPFVGEADVPGAPPVGSDTALIQGSDGNFYGVSSIGGDQGYGTVYRCTPAGVLTILRTFSVSDGATPEGALVQGSDGSFYGTLSAGFGAPGDLNLGPGGYFQIKAGGGYTVLHEFASTGNGPSQAFGNLVEFSPGFFVGVTAGGTTQNGTISRLYVTPTIVSPTKAAGKVGVAFTYQIRAFDGPMSYSAKVLPAGLVINTKTGLISGKPIAPGTHALTIAAYNGAGGGSEALTLTIAP